MTQDYRLSAMAVASCLGIGNDANAARLFTGTRDGLVPRDGYLPGRTAFVGAIPDVLPELPARFSQHNSRNNRLLYALATDISGDLQAAISRYGAGRIAVILGTSTSGIAEADQAVAHYRRHDQWPDGFDYRLQETGSPADFIASLLGITGPAYVVATACSSSAKVFASARRLIAAGIVDAAVVGGADTLCRLTLAGFTSLEAMSDQRCNPFRQNRSGITIGEGGALFLMERGAGEINLLGIGETSDAHHISAPEPEGRGAIAAMEAALADAGLTAGDIAYVNLHGTATALNDSMESRAVNGLFGSTVPCSSTKAMTGHTLGAAGAVEAAFLWLTLSQGYNPDGRLPPQLGEGDYDPDLPPLALTDSRSRFGRAGTIAMLSNSFAFGGSNCALVLGRR